MLYSTVLSRSAGEGGQVLLQPLHSYREILRGGSRELLRSNFMNALLFFPAGLLGVSALPAKWPGWCRVLAVFALLMGLSVGVEAIQYACRLGNVEADDVLHNALGAALGCLAGMISFQKRK